MEMGKGWKEEWRIMSHRLKEDTEDFSGNGHGCFHRVNVFQFKQCISRMCSEQTHLTVHSDSLPSGALWEVGS